MPFPRPTLSTLRSQAMQDITASDLPNADGFLRRAVLRVLAWVQAGLAHLHYGYLDWIARQATPATATDEFLEFWAALAPTPVLRQAPKPASGAASFTGVAGKLIPAGTIVLRGDGAQFQVTADSVVIGSTATVLIAAVVAGSAGNTDSGAPLTLSGALEGINGTGSAAGALTGGSDLELDDALRARMLESYATPPAGGAAGDYRTWALAVAGVTAAWTLRNGMGPGTVVVYFMMDEAQAAHGGFPQGSNGVSADEPRDTAATGDQLAVADAIYPLQPVTALVYAVAPGAQPVNFTVGGLASASADLRAQVTAAIAGALQAKRSPLADTGIYQSDIDAAIAAVPGVPPFAVTLPASWPILPTAGSVLTLGSVSYP